jgi:hypothetical protein
MVHLAHRPPGYGSTMTSLYELAEVAYFGHIRARNERPRAKSAFRNWRLNRMRKF